ncbi:MAG: sugar phosphate nucleotidyltransferase [Bdellovibrionales bacterium]
MSEVKKVRKAVIAAAGFGTRFLPQTKAMPKEMLPLVDKPIIQHIVEELVDAGIEDIMIVTGYHKRSIEDHFDNISAELTRNLKRAGKLELLTETRKISKLANFAYIRQKGVLGNASPLLETEHLIGDEPVIYTYADDFIEASPSRFKQMISLYEQTGSSVLSCMEVVNEDDYERYGIVAGTKISDSVLKMSSIVEKPGHTNAPSNLASVSGYLLTPKIFDFLRDGLGKVQEGDEFMIQPVMCDMITAGNEMLALKIENGKYYDTGNKLEYLKTLIDFGLKNQEIGPGLTDYLRRVIQ